MFDNLKDLGWTFLQEYFISTGYIFTVIISIAIFLLFWLLGKIFTSYILKILLKITEKTKTTLDNQIVIAFEKPFKLLFIFLGIYFAFLYLPLQPSQDILLSRFFRSSLIFLLALGFYNFASNQIVFAEEVGNIFNVKIDKILIPLISKAIQVIIVFLAIVIIAQEWDYDVNGFIAGLGLGGLAFALAAQDTLSNIFGGIVIITDKPFSIGDWILTPSVEGTVEDINFRSTKVRTFAQAVVTVPNSKLANEPITNWSKMGKRRINFNLGVTYSTSKDKLEKCVKQIEEMLRNDPGIHDETIFVRFDSFGNNSLNIFIYCFTNTTVWGEFLKVKESVNYKIMDILEKEGVEVAFPSTSIYFENKLQTNDKIEER